MADQGFELDVFRDLLEEAGIVGRLADNEKAFRSAYAAFRAGNRGAFQTALRQLELVPRCELVCEWIRVKECVLLCLELCGPPKVAQRPPNPRVLAEAFARIAADERAVRQLAQAIEKRDRAAFQRLVTAYKLGPICHFFCHWVCSIHYRLVCRWVCRPELRERPDLVEELQAAGQALRALLESRKVFDQAVAASSAGDAERLGNVIRDAGLFQFCPRICFFFCSWRCMLVCLNLCREFPLAPVEDPLKEAFAFAKVTEELAQKPADLERLSAAVGAGDLKAFVGIVGELRLQAFCIQLCHWLCFVRCRAFCIIVCPPVYPWFSQIGAYDFTSEINSATNGNGLTVSGSYAFFLAMRLNGALAQSLGGDPYEYRFEVVKTDAKGNPSGAWAPVLPAQIAATQIGVWQPTNKKVWVNNAAPGPGEHVTTISADGWIQVPQSIGGTFVPNGDLIKLMSQTLDPWPHHDESGVITGNPAKHPLVNDQYYGLRMRVRKQGDTGGGADAGTCTHVAIDNTLYDNVKPHPAWDGGAAFPPGQYGVVMVNVAELGTTGCQGITNSLTVEFTAAHPNLGSVSITMSGGGSTWPFKLPALPETGDWYGTATPDGWTVKDLKPCAYLITLEESILLTTGDDYLVPQYDHIAFCKKPG
jgi:hypothetical protein